MVDVTAAVKKVQQQNRQCYLHQEGSSKVPGDFKMKRLQDMFLQWDDPPAHIATLVQDGSKGVKTICQPS